MQEFKDREAALSEAEQRAATYSAREKALAQREQSVSSLEDSAQKANAAAEYARQEAEGMWNKQKVSSILWGKHAPRSLKGYCHHAHGVTSQFLKGKR